MKITQYKSLTDAGDGVKTLILVTGGKQRAEALNGVYDDRRLRQNDRPLFWHTSNAYLRFTDEGDWCVSGSEAKLANDHRCYIYGRSPCLSRDA